MTNPMCQKENLCKENGEEQVDETLYISLIGCLMYLTATRPNILYVVSILSRFMNSAKESHLKVAKKSVEICQGDLKL